MDKSLAAVAGKKRWAGSARQIILGAAILMAAGQSALAASTTLVCSSSNNGSLGPDVFELNEAQRSATITFSSVRANNGDILPGRSSGVLPATFTPNTITISSAAYGTVNTYVINRLTATVALTQTASDGHVAGYSNWTCHVGKAKF